MRKFWKKRKDGEIVPSRINSEGYEVVDLEDRYGKIETRRVDELVAEAFIPNPDNKKYVIHKDDNKLNNRADNLEWSDTPEV